MDIIVYGIALQSNGNGRNTNDGTYVDRSNLYQWDSATGALDANTSVLKHPENLDRTGMDDQIADDLATLNPSAMVVIVPCAYGGTGYAAGGGWFPAASGGGARFENWVTQMNAAMAYLAANYPSDTIIPILHGAGGENEGDAGLSYATCLAGLTDFINYSRSRITGASGARVILSSTLPKKWTVGNGAYSAGYANENQAKIACSLNLSNVTYVVGSRNNSADDGLHYQPAAVARATGSLVVSAIYDTTGPTVTSPTTSGTQTGATLAVALTGNDANGHQTFHIVGGADAAQFEISDPYLTPTLRWVSNGTGPGNGAYVVQVQARDGSGNYGSTWTHTATVAAEISPVAFFTAGESGMVWDLTDLSTLWQDIAGTATAVTAAGQVVGRVKDKSPNGNDWIAFANDTSRPTYQVDSDGKPYLQFDGSNDTLYAAPFRPGGTITANGQLAFASIIGYNARTSANAVDGGTGRGLLSQAATTGTATFLEVGSDNTTATSLRSTLRNDASGGGGANGIVTNAFDGNKQILTSRYAGHSGAAKNRRYQDRGTGLATSGYVSTTLSIAASTFTFARACLGARAFFTSGTPNRSNPVSGRVYSGFAISRDILDTETKAGEDWVAARTLSSSVSIPIGRADEADTAYARAATQILAVGLGAEADSAYALAGKHLRAVGLAVETDAALALGRAVAITPAIEADAAFALAPVASIVVGRADEADTALALAAIQATTVGRANETDVAFALTTGQTGVVGLAIEADAAYSRPAVQSSGAGRAEEANAALALSAVQKRAAGLATEIDTGFALALVSIRSVSAANENDAAFSLAAVHVGTVGIAIEIDAAFALFPADYTPPETPPDRVGVVPAENRALTVAAEYRSLSLPMAIRVAA